MTEEMVNDKKMNDSEEVAINEYSNTRTNDSNNVIVGCKLIHGITFDVGGKKVLINGQNTNKIIALNGYTGEAAYTTIPAEIWNEIKKIYGKMTHFVEGLIFAHKNENSVKAMAEEKKEVKTGAEQLDANSVPNVSNHD